MPKINLIFTNWSIDTGVFFEEETFHRTCEVDEAIANSKTWGEFRELLPQDLFEILPFWNVNGGGRVYWDGDNYLCIDASKLDGFLREMEGEDESWYVFKHSDQLNITEIADYDHSMWVVGQSWTEFSTEFNERFASHTGHPANGSWTEYSMDEYEEMRDFLSYYGFTVRRIEYYA